MKVVIGSLGLALILAVAPAALAKGKAPAGMPRGLAALLKHVEKQPKAAGKPATAKAKDCANLSGKWKGSCTDMDGETYDDEYEVEQDGCDEISFGGYHFAIGGAAQMGGTGEDFTSYISIFPRWNANRAVLRVFDSVSFMSSPDGWVVLGRGTSEYSLLEGKLITKSHSSSDTVAGGNPSTYEYYDECVYEAQAR